MVLCKLTLAGIETPVFTLAVIETPVLTLAGVETPVLTLAGGETPVPCLTLITSSTSDMLLTETLPC